MEEKNQIKGGTLYLVSTPIGNLSDISERALKTLAGVDFVAAEDTRNSVRLLTHFGIKKPLVSYHEHNKREKGGEICARLEAGESCALITDAGTPAISDPGEELAALAAERGIDVTAVPGCCAAITALTLSGLSTRRFTFEGFLSASKKERMEQLDALKYEKRTMIFHEAPHKLRAALSDMLAVFGGERRISLCRELTKLNEEIFRTTLETAVEHYKENEPRGEYVLVVEGAAADEPKKPDFWAEMTVTEHVDHYISAGMSKNDAIKTAAKDRGVGKNVVYKEYVTNGNS